MMPQPAMFEARGQMWEICHLNADRTTAGTAVNFIDEKSRLALQQQLQTIFEATIATNLPPNVTLITTEGYRDATDFHPFDASHVSNPKASDFNRGQYEGLPGNGQITHTVAMRVFFGLVAQAARPAGSPAPDAHLALSASDQGGTGAGRRRRERRSSVDGGGGATSSDRPQGAAAAPLSDSDDEDAAAAPAAPAAPAAAATSAAAAGSAAAPAAPARKRALYQIGIESMQIILADMRRQWQSFGT